MISSIADSKITDAENSLRLRGEHLTKFKTSSNWNTSLDEALSIEVNNRKRSSGIDLQYNLLVFINDILQVPGESYTFNGGSTIRFNEAPKPRLAGYTTPGDTCKLMIYTGTQSIDVNEVNVIETLKVGDEVQIFSDLDVTLNQDRRIVVDINSADTVVTNTYAGQGVSDTELLERPINWIKQTSDKIIDEIEVGKDRKYYEPNIHSQSIILSNVGIGSSNPDAKLRVQGDATFTGNVGLNDTEFHLRGLADPTHKLYYTTFLHNPYSDNSPYQNQLVPESLP